MSATDQTLDEKLVVKRKELELVGNELQIIKVKILIVQAQQELAKLENPQ